MGNNEAEFSTIVRGKVSAIPAFISRKANITTTVRIAATRDLASNFYESALFSGDVLLLSGSAWDDRTGARVAVPEEALAQQIRLAIGDALYCKMLPWMATEAEYGVATWHFFVLVDESGVAHHPTPLQVAAMNRQKEARAI